MNKTTIWSVLVLQKVLPKTKLFYLLPLTVAVFTTSAAQAAVGGLFVEPGITYETGEAKADWPTPLGSSNISTSGFGLLAKVGFHLNEAFFVALDARYSKPTLKDGGYEAASSAMNYGPAIGVQMPDVGFRVWGSYILGGELDPEESSSIESKFTSASGYRVGIGFRLIPVSLNLEYQTMKYGTSDVELGGIISSDDVDATSNAYILSVTFPLEF